MLALSLEQFDTMPIWLAGLLLAVLMATSLMAGRRLRSHVGELSPEEEKEGSSFDGDIVSAVLGLLALLLGFTYSLAIQRFEERRQLIVSEANAIEAAYLHVQILAPPHRERLSKLILGHLDAEIRLAETGYPGTGALREEDERILMQIWAETVSVLAAPKNAFLAVPLTSSMDSMIDVVASRRAAWSERVPSGVFAVLWVYLLSVAGVLGYQIGHARRTFLTYFVLGLMAVSLLLVLDIDRPGSGLTGESQRPMLQLRDTLVGQSAATP